MQDNRPRAFLFDMDGVICDNNAWHRTTWLAYAEQLGKKLSEQDIETKVYGKTNAEILAFVLGRPVDADELHQHAESKEALFRQQYGPHFALTPGLEAFLEAAKIQDIAIGLATNAPLSNLEFTWQKGQLSRFFKVRTHAAEVTHPKPAPDLYLLCAERLGVAAAQSVVFEDSLTGIRAARAAGAKVVGVASTISEAVLAPLCNKVITDFSQITPADVLAL